MSTRRSESRDPVGVGVLGGIVYSVVVSSWFASRGVSLSSGDVVTALTAIGYSVGGLFLVAAVPLYLLGRFSLVLPAGTTVWFLDDAVYQELYGTHLHPLSSYLTVWPLLFAVALVAGFVEALIRFAGERAFGLGGCRSLV